MKSGKRCGQVFSKLQQLQVDAISLVGSIRKHNNKEVNMTCLSALCSDGAKKAYLGIYATAVLMAYPLTIYYEHYDSVLVEKVSAAFARCVADNVTSDSLCCVAGWSEIIAQEHHNPLMSIVSTALMPVLTFGLGLAAYKAITVACNAKGKYEYTPVPETLNPNDDF